MDYALLVSIYSRLIVQNIFLTDEDLLKQTANTHHSTIKMQVRMKAKKGNLENQTFKRSSRDSDDIYLMVFTGLPMEHIYLFSE